MEKNSKTGSNVVKPLTEEEKSRFKKLTNEERYEFIRVGPQGYFFLSSWLEHAEAIRKMPLRSTDTWVVSFAQSGTTWAQELVWLVNNNLNFEEAKAVPLVKRFSSIEKVLMNMLTPIQENLAKTPSPRFIKSHLPLSLLPDKILDTSKVVYVARDSRDVAVSFYHFYKGNTMTPVLCEFKEFFDLFVNDLSKAGGRRDYFDAEMTAQAQAWMQHNLQDTDLRFPLHEF